LGERIAAGWRITITITITIRIRIAIMAGKQRLERRFRVSDGEIGPRQRHGEGR
jgi:hypothetical protein